MAETTDGIAASEALEGTKATNDAPAQEQDSLSILASVKDKADGEQAEQSGQSEQKANESPESPVTLDAIKLPEGAERNEELGKSFLDIVNDGKLSKAEMAQKLATLYSEELGKFTQGMAAAHKAAEQKLAEDLNAEDQKWIAACKADAEYGGDKWNTSQALIAKGRDRLASPELVQFLESNLLGNNPEIIRLFYRAGKLYAEDQSIRGQSQATGKNPAAHWSGITKGMFED